MGKGILQPPADIREQVALALREDLGAGDVTSSLLPAGVSCQALLLCREAALICGQAWVAEVYRQLSGAVQINWLVSEGASIPANTECAQITGPAVAVLSGERTALNFLQMLSATATTTAEHVQLIKHTQARLLDTRKTIPGLRHAQKYAVACGGGSNHRMGLFDAFLLKENHILAMGGIRQAILAARQQSATLTLEIEVETLAQLQQAIAAEPDIILLDNFALADMKKAVALTPEHIKLEASGGVARDSLVAIAETGVDYISAGAITKHIKAIDLSLRIQYT